MYKLCFYVPETHLDEVKEAVFATGAGKIGDYDSCCWQTRGQGQFRSLPGSQPFIGEQDIVVQVNECKVELVCGNDKIRAAVSALVKTHPYEKPAYDVWSLEEF